MEQNVMGSAERIVQMITGFVDHMIHNRPGVVSLDPTALFGAKWVTHKLEEAQKVVYRCDKQGKKTVRVCRCKERWLCPIMTKRVSFVMRTLKSQCITVAVTGMSGQRRYREVNYLA
jgi:hypothetical protein